MQGVFLEKHLKKDSRWESFLRKIIMLRMHFILKEYAA